MPEPGDNGKTFVGENDHAFYSQPQYEPLDADGKRRVLQQFKVVVEAEEIRERAMEGGEEG